MDDIVLGRKVLSHQSPDRVPADPHGARDAPQRLVRGMPALDLLPPGDPGRTPVSGFFLLRTERPLGIDCCRRLSHRDGDPSAPGAQHLIQGLAGILEEVKPVGDLECLGCTLPRSFGIRLRPVSHDNLDTGMSAQPGGQRLGGPPREEIDRSMGLEINQERGVHLTATEGEIIDTEDPWGWCQRENRVTQQTQQCHPQAGTRTDGQTRGASQTRSGLSSCRLYQIEQKCAGVRGATNSGEERCPEALGKGAALTVAVVTTEAANGERDLHGARPPGEVNRVALVAVVHPGAGDAAGRTAPATNHPRRLQHDRATVETDQGITMGQRRDGVSMGEPPCSQCALLSNLPSRLPISCGRAHFRPPYTIRKLFMIPNRDVHWSHATCG